MKAKFGLALAVTILGLTVAVYASEYNFYEQADKKGCSSIITERGQDECARVQRAKDDACKIPVDCDVDKQERAIVKYKEAKDRLDRGQVADADKDKLKDTIRALKDELDTRKDDARRGTSIAQGCVTARENVQKWFMETGIPLTERTRDDALRIRKELLDKLGEAQRKQAAPDGKLDIAAVWSDLRELRRIRVEVIPIRRRDFEADRDTPGELAEAVAREGRLVYGR